MTELRIIVPSSLAEWLLSNASDRTPEAVAALLAELAMLAEDEGDRELLRLPVAPGVH